MQQKVRAPMSGHFQYATAVRAMGRDEIVWWLQHVWPKGMPDVTEINLSKVDDDEAGRLVNQVQDVRRAFERFIAEEVLPHVSRRPTRAGSVESLRLFTSQHSMNTDYLLLLNGIVGGSGGVLDQIAERYTIRTTEELGSFCELETYRIPEPSE